MSWWRKPAQMLAVIFGMAGLFLGIFLCLRRLELYYYAYKARELAWTISLRQEAAYWALAAVLIVPSVFLVRFAKGLKKSKRSGA